MTTTTTNFKSIQLLRQWCMLTLPTVFNDALSYNEQVCKLTEAINEMATTINGLPDYIIELVKELLDQMNLEEIVKQVLADYFFINVKNPPAPLVGAKGDGIANDTAAIQAMIDYVAGKKTYLFFPGGTYSVNQLVMKTGVSLIGEDRYRTIINLEATSNVDLLGGDMGDCTIANIMLNANMQAQSQNVSCIKATAKDILLTNLILKNGYDSLSLVCNGYVQANSIVFDGIQNDAISLSENGVCDFDNIVFTRISPLNGRTLVYVQGNNKHLTNLLCNDNCVNGVIVNGNNNRLSGVITAATNTVNNTGNNLINIFTGKVEYNQTGEVVTTATSIRETLTGDKSVNSANSTETVLGDKSLNAGNSAETLTGNKTVSIGEDLTQSITGNYNENVGMNKSETILGNKTVKADLIYLDPTQPLKYANVKVLNSYFNYIDMQDENGNPYKVLVAGEGTNSLSNARAQNITARRIGRILTTDNNHTADAGATLNYSYAQGSFVFEDKGKILIAFIPFNTADVQLNNNLMLREYSIIDGTLIREKVVPSGGHGNGIGYNPETDTVYIVQTFMWQSKGVSKGSKFILELDYATLSVQKTYEIQTDFVDGLTFVSYDTGTGKLWTGTSYYIFEIDTETHAVLQTVPIKYPPSLAKGFTSQSAYIHNGIMYAVISHPEMLIMHDTSGNYVAMYNMPYWVGGIFAWGENESLTMLKDGTLYITTCGEAGPGSENEMIQIFAVNPEQTQAYYQPYYGNWSFYSQLYIDSNATGFNPDGTQANPFKISAEAVQILHSPEYWKQNVIVNFVKGSYDALRLYDIDDKDFQCNGSTFSMVAASRCTNLYFNNLIIDKTNFNLREAISMLRVEGAKFNACYLKASDAINNISTSVIHLELSAVTWVGGLNPTDSSLINIETYTDNKLFNLVNSSWICEYRFRNMNFSYNKLIPTSYVLCSTPIAVGKTQPLNSAITEGKVNAANLRSNFRFINFYIETNPSRSEKFTFYRVNSASADYYIRYYNLPDKPALGGIAGQFHELLVRVTDTDVTLVSDNLINLTAATTTGAVTASVTTGTSRVMFVEISDN